VEAGLYIGVDLGGTKIAAALLTEEGKVLNRKQIPTRAEEGPERIIQRIEELIDELSADREIRGIGVAAPGPLDANTGILYSPPNLPGWKDIPLKDLLEHRFQLPVHVENDANAAAWGEYWWGAGKRRDPMLYLTVSTGVGGGWVLGGQLFRGVHTYAGEVGHTIVDPDGPPCSCGRSGCLESLVSGWAMAKRWREWDGKKRELTAEQIFALHREGDPLAGKLVGEAIRHLAIGLSNLVHLFDPSLIVIGGGISRAGDLLFFPLRQELEKWLMPAFQKSCEVIPAELGPDAGTWGAAALAIRACSIHNDGEGS